MKKNLVISDLFVFLFFSVNLMIILNLPEFIGGILFTHIFEIQILIFVCFAISSLNFEQLIKLKLPNFNSDFFLFSILILLFLISSFWINLEPNLKFDAALKLISYPINIYFFFFYIPKKLLEKSILVSFLWVVLIFSIINALMGLIGISTGILQNSIFPGHSLGLFKHPNTHAFIYTIIFPIILYLYYEKKITITVLILFSILFFSNLFLTYSRAGFLGFVVGLLTFFFFKSKRTFIFIFLFSVLMSFFFLSDVSQVKTDSSLPRILLIVSAIQMISSGTSRFLWGYGVNDAIEIFKTEKVFLGSLEIVPDPHNWILTLGIQFGMLVPITVFIIVARIFYHGSKKYKSNPRGEYSNELILAMSIVLALFIENFFEALITYPEYFLMPFFLMMLGYIKIIYAKTG
ncbi:MAG: O-antigen ligase family protein [Bacteroidetes bacterium]|nr:O-antigen ligase family protein [Bacteroidota bacterium]